MEHLTPKEGGHFVPVDTFGRQAGQGFEQPGMRPWNWQGSYGPGRVAQSFEQPGAFRGTQGPLQAQPIWQSTASQILYERQFGNAPPQVSRRDHQWGGLLPGDVPDTNHGDLTRGGLDQRGVNLSGVTRASGVAAGQFTGPAGDVPEGFPPPSPGPHVMASHIVTDGGQVARVWGDRDERTPRVGSLRTGGWMSDTRFIYGGQTETQRVSEEQPRFQGQLGWAHLDTRRQPDVPDSSDLYGPVGPANTGTGSAPWYGPSTDQGRYDGAWSRSLVRPTGPVSLPATRMEAAEEWDGVDLSPWSQLTSPTPLDT